MSNRRIFLDTVFIQALLNRRDQHHAQAKALLPAVREALEVWLTEAVPVEVANALSALRRTAAARFIQQCYRTDNMHVVPVDTALLRRALQLYEERPDKEWGLTDCISFIVMQDQGLTEAATADGHFAQAGFRVLL